MSSALGISASASQTDRAKITNTRFNLTMFMQKTKKHSRELKKNHEVFSKAPVDGLKKYYFVACPSLIDLRRLGRLVSQQRTLFLSFH